MSLASDPAVARHRSAHARPSRQATPQPAAAPSPYAANRAASSDVMLDHYLKRVDPAVAQSFSAEQRAAIKTMLGARGAAKHLVEVRHSVPVGRRRWYVVFLLGTERRALPMAMRDGAGSRPYNLLFYLVLGALVVAPAIGLIAALGR